MPRKHHQTNRKKVNRWLKRFPNVLALLRLQRKKGKK